MTYDKSVDAAFIYLTDPIEHGEVVRGDTFGRDLDQTAVLGAFDAEGRLLGIELLGVSRLVRPESLPEQ
jgi:hypothetical protein